MIERQPDDLGRLHSLWTFNSNGSCSMRWYENNISDEDDGYEEKGTYILKNDTIYFVAITEAEYRYYVEQLTENGMILQYIEEGSRYIFEKSQK